MSASLPERLDPRRACVAANSYRGETPLSALPRLAGMLDPAPGDDDPRASWELRFGRDGSGRAVVRGTVQALLPLRCQRCGEPFSLPVSAELALAVVARLVEVESLPPEYDPLVVPTDGPEQFIAPRDLIEDELILAVPDVPRHGDGECAPPSVPAQVQGAEVESQPNPFAMLAALKAKP